MISSATVLAILSMASVTYLTRIGGYVLLPTRTLGPRAAAVMEPAPGCVLIALTAPNFVWRNPADLLALAVTVLAATRLSMLSTVLIAVAAAGLLRHLPT